MKQSIGALLILGSVLQISDSFVTKPSAVGIPSARTQKPVLPACEEDAAVSSSTARWASTMDKQEVEEKTEIDDNESNVEMPNFTVDEDNSGSASLGERITNSGVASAAAMATAAVNAAVSMKSLEAPDVAKSYIALDKTQQELDEEGLPLVYDKDVIEAYWSKERGALNKRWGYFVGKAVPFLTKLTTLFIRDGKIVDEEIPALSRRARMDLQDLGPTFIKAGQMMSVRPDVLPTATLDELTKLQDSVEPFDTKVAVEQIEKELGGPLGKFFTSISEEPVAAASLAQVYLATLNDGKDTKVAVKVQRPSVLGTVSKDLYVLRRAAEVFQGLVERFAPQQRTNYVALLNEWSIGFYTELDFNNEARNQQKLRDMLLEKKVKGVKVPKVYNDLCTRRILVSEWVEGKKLSDASNEEIKRVTPFAQEAFLTQLFEVGFFHADPHPGNLMLLDEPTEDGVELALIDCGLMAEINEVDRDFMISAVIHLANKDYASLVDDFIKLKILPEDTNRATVIPLMDKALSPYVKGGGAKKYEEEVRKLYNMEDGNMQSQVGGFQAMTQDALTVLNDIPFSIPPYFAILGRAIVTLEGVALTGNPEYGIILEAYPFIARKLLTRESSTVQKALQEVLYSSNADGTSGLKLSRLLALLNNAAGSVATQDGAVFVDIDAVPEDGISFEEGLKFIMSDDAESLRTLLEPEVDSIVDILMRQIFRQGIQEAVVALTPPRPPALPFLGDILPPSPNLEELPIPLLLPGAEDGRSPSVKVTTIKKLTEAVAPKLSQDDELFALGLADAAQEFFGEGMGDFVRGESVFSTESIEILLSGLRSGIVGKTDVLSPEAIETVVNTVTSTLNLVQGSSSSESSLEKQLRDALNNLDATEKERFDGVVNELTERTITRLRNRLSRVESI
eukprot:CAMPEP_0197176156 /NCGR_PEP_ID=MMETSP1423-20130617/2175_1 /TAXON_ID=476441 /ORGANISM="Pseudo-nitzschia heimii, Strain UNC1101" /LENGTH=906 /DNA_ID=CAMNT_0042625479 /DNA_START=161 /DNA_END=2881 /DNA_ORIENTATION=-